MSRTARKTCSIQAGVTPNRRQAISGTAAILKVLAEPTRLQIVYRLQHTGPATVSALAQELGRPITVISYDLSYLREVGLVAMKPRGKFREYSIHPDVLRGDELAFGCCRFKTCAK